MDLLELLVGRQREALDLIAGVDGILEGAVLHLAKNAPPDIRASVLSDWEECDYTGYETGALTFSAAYISPGDGRVYVSAPSVLFLTDDPTPPAEFVENTVIAWFVTDTAGTLLIGGGRLPDPVGLTEPNQGLEIGVDLPYGG